MRKYIIFTAFLAAISTIAYSTGVTLPSSGGTGAGAVDSVFGRTGDVTAVTNDYTWAQINKTVSSIADITTRNHSDLTDDEPNQHIDHTGVTLTAGSGISGGGTIATNRTFDLEFTELSAATVATGDLVAIADIDDSNAIKKVTAQAIADLAAGGITPPGSSTDNAVVRWDGTGGDTVQDSGVTIDDSNDMTVNDVTVSTPSNIYALSHDSWADFVANEHVDHSGVTLTAGDGISGGGDITTNRSFALDINGIANAGTTIGASDLFAYYDATTDTQLEKITWSNLEGAISHGNLADLTSADDHTQYFHLTGRSGGQTAIGGTGAGDSLIFNSSSDSDEGNFAFEDADAFLVYIDGTTPSGTIASTIDIQPTRTAAGKTATAGTGSILLTNNGLIRGCGTGCSILGGGSHDINGGANNYQTLVGGSANDITATQNNNTIVGGDNDLIAGASFTSVIAGGRYNNITASDYALATGAGALINAQDYTFAIGHEAASAALANVGFMIDGNAVMSLGRQTAQAKDGTLASVENVLRLHNITANEQDNYIGLKANTAITTSTTYTLPVDGSADDIMTTDGSGNLTWQTPTYCEIYVAGGSTAQSIPTGAGYTQMTGFASDGASSNCTNAVASDKVTATQTGFYKLEFSVSFTSGTTGVVWNIAAFVNGAQQTQCEIQRKTSTNDVGDTAASCYVDISTASWDVDLRISHDNGGSVDFTPTQANLNINRVGGT